MTAPRLQEVVARVVAWHNRHPLARRIDASQVHSIGEVRLPFASSQPWGGQAAAATPPAAPPPPAQAVGQATSLADALAQRSARHAPAPAAAGIDGLDVQSMLPDADPGLLDPLPLPHPPHDPPAGAAGDATHAAAAPQDPAPATDSQATADPDPDPGSLAADNADADDDGEAALVIPLLDGDEPAAPARADADPATDPAADPAADPAGDFAVDLPADTATDHVADTHGAQADGPVADAASAPAAAAAAGPADQGATADEFPDVYPPPHGNVPASALARAVERRAAALGAHAAAAAAAHDTPHGPADGHADGHAADAAPAPSTGTTAAVTPPATGPAPSRWRRLRTALTGRQPGMPPLRAAFSQDFAWPLRPGQVARWAQRHGSPQPLAPADWPHRTVDTDRPRLAALRQKGRAHDLPLHVLTAAIGVGDRRIRVLVGADGSVLGPRAYHRGRVGSLAVLLALGLVGTGWTLRPLHGPAGADEAAVLAALAASAAASAAAVPASAPNDAASATAVADAGSAAGHAATAADPAASGTAAELAQAHADAASSAPDAHAGDAHAASPGDAASQPQADIRPVLTDAQKYAARVDSAKARGEPPPQPPPEAIAGPVYAVVGPVSRQREAAAGSLAQMRATAARLQGTVPEHGELVESQGQWRAAWWPFSSLVDAERARVLLAGKGIKAEVIEF